MYSSSSYFETSRLLRPEIWYHITIPIYALPEPGCIYFSHFSQAIKPLFLTQGASSVSLTKSGYTPQKYKIQFRNKRFSLDATNPLGDIINSLLLRLIMTYSCCLATIMYCMYCPWPKQALLQQQQVSDSAYLHYNCPNYCKECTWRDTQMPSLGKASVNKRLT